MEFVGRMRVALVPRDELVRPRRAVDACAAVGRFLLRPLRDAVRSRQDDGFALGGTDRDRLRLRAAAVDADGLAIDPGVDDDDIARFGARNRLRDGANLLGWGDQWNLLRRNVLLPGRSGRGAGQDGQEQQQPCVAMHCHRRFPA
jgi:hypothetical protein